MTLKLLRTEHHRELHGLLFTSSLCVRLRPTLKGCEMGPLVYRPHSERPESQYPFADVILKAAISPQLFKVFKGFSPRQPWQ